MPLLQAPAAVRAVFIEAGQRATPLLCPNVETPDEMEGLLLAAEQHRTATGRDRLAVGAGITASYPDHPQLERLGWKTPARAQDLAATARRWLGWLRLAADSPDFAALDVIPFLDHGWVPSAADRALMDLTWFQEEMGLILYDASALDFDDNLRQTADYVERAGSRVLVEGCPDKVYERAELERKGLRPKDLLSDPDQVARFHQESGVFLVVPNLGTEHRSAGGGPPRYHGKLARALCERIGPRLALHGTSSLGGNLRQLGGDGICKINYYTAMAREASARLRRNWAEAGDPSGIGLSCGSFIHRTRREAVRENLCPVFQSLTISSN